MAKQQPQKKSPAQQAKKPIQQQPAKRQAPPKTAAATVLNGPWWIGIVAAVFGIALYANTIGHDYTLDDFGAIKENWIVKGQYFGKIFSTEYRFGSWASPGSLYRPLTLAMFSVEWWLVPEKPWLSHLINVLLYGMTGWLMWITWRRIFSAYHWSLAAMVVFLFMAHPVHTEVVANIKSRDEIVSMLGCTFALYAIWRYFESDQQKWIIMSVVAYGLSLFAKESGITFLAIFPLTMYYFSKQPAGRIATLSALFVIPAVIFLLIRLKVLSNQPYAETYSILDVFIVGAKNSADRLASAFMMCLRYLQTLVFPHPLVSDMGYPQMKPVSFTDLRALGGLFVYVGMGIYALIGLGKRSFLSYAIWVYLITFSLFSNVIMVIGTSYGERLLYAPSLGFAFATAWLLYSIFKNKTKEDPSAAPSVNGTVLWSIAGVLLVAYSLKTVTRNGAWKNSSALYDADYKTSPDCAKLNYHRALEITGKGLDEKTSAIKDTTLIKQGIDAYTRTIELYPEYHDAYGSRGLAYFRLQKYDKAFEDYQKALKFRPNDAKVLSNLGYIYFLRAQRPGNQLATTSLDSAESVYRRSIQYDPRFVDARRNLGAVLAMKKNFPPAIEQWKEGLKYEPKSAILHYYIGSAYKDMGDMGNATPWLEKAYALEPSLRK